MHHNSTINKQRNMDISSKTLLRLVVLSMAISPTLSLPEARCKCFMCICDVDPHPQPPAVPSHYSPPPPPPEYYPPPSTEPETVYPAQPPPPFEFPWEETYDPPPPVLMPEIVDAPGQLYPQDSAFNPSGAHRRSHLLNSSVVLAFLLVSGVFVYLCCC